MKKIILLIILLSTQNITFANTQEGEQDHEHEHATPFTPEEEERYFEDMGRGFKRKSFPRTNWNECSDRRVTGNYLSYRCTRQRNISQILFTFMKKNFETCVDKAAKSNNWRMKDFHIIHKGIFGDARHSPRSLHSPGRAIDIAEIIVSTYGGNKKMNFRKYGNGEFFTAFRKCWGRAIISQNNCPAYRGQVQLTGSIGKEDRNHQKHLHVSVPYCVKGKHAGNYFWR